jgi:hypothetical protein
VTSRTAAVPLTIDEVTPQWLTAILRTDDTLPDDATVTDLRAEQIAMDSGFSSLLYRLHLSGGGVPESVVVKLPALSDAGEAMKMLAGLSLERARSCIGQLAGLHAWSTDAANAKALGEFPRLDTPMMRDLPPAACEPAWGIYLDKADVPVPPAVAQYAERFAELAPWP